MTTQEYNWLLSGMQKAAAAAVQAAQPTGGPVQTMTPAQKDQAMWAMPTLASNALGAYNRYRAPQKKPVQTFWNRPRVNNDWLDRAGAAYTNTWNKIKGAGKSAINWAQSPSGSQTLKWFLQDPPAYNRQF